MDRYDYDVAILGAGPTGLTLANLLGTMGVRTCLVERNPATVQAPRAVSIDDECLRTQQAAGTVDAVLRDVAMDYGSHYLSADGVCFARVEPREREYGYPRRSAFLQPLFEATLRDELARFPHVTAHFGVACESFVEDETGVTLSLKPNEGEPSRIRVKYMAGCDGARSETRRAIGAELEGTTYRERWLIVDLAETDERLRQTRVICDPARPHIVLPGPYGTRRYEFMVHEHENEDAISSAEFVRGLLAASGPDADARVVRRQVYTFHARMVDKWNTRRVFLAGDAAHLTPPFAGQGMNSGVRDAHNLSWKLAAVLHGELGPGLLASYQTERAPHAWSLIALAINLGRVMMPRGALQAKLVQTGFRVASLIPSVQAYFAQMKYKPKPYFRDGFLVPGGERDIVGRMLPQPMLEGRDRNRFRFDDWQGSDFAFVAYGFDAQGTMLRMQQLDFGLPKARRLAIVPMRFNIDRRADPAIEAARDVDDLLGRYAKPNRELLLLVRPDRYVAGAVDVMRAGALKTWADDLSALVKATFEAA
jgi:3-(3-hydroxy-phenyl)propionate hydroxylase